VSDRGRDGASRVATVSLAPALEQPIRRITRHVTGLHGCAHLRDATQYGIHEAGVPCRTPVGLSEAHRQVDGCMVGNLEPKNLSRPEQEDGLGARRVRGKSLFEKSPNQMAKCAKAPQNRRSQPARQRAVAVGKCGKARMGVFAGEKLVERDAAPQHAVEDIGGDSSGGKAGDFRLG